MSPLYPPSPGRPASLGPSSPAPPAARAHAAWARAAWALGACALAAWALAALGACDRRAPEPSPVGPPRPAPVSSRVEAPAASPAASMLSGRFARPPVDRVVAIGDLHGDLDVTRKALRLAGAIDDNDRWAGGGLVVVQVGDAIDRGDDDRRVLDLLEKLRGEAAKAGGALVLLSGNHELMNVAFDFRYITPPSFSAFLEFKPPRTDDPRLLDLTPAERGRAVAFAPGGPYATMLAERPIVASVGTTVFVHGGILPEHVTYGLDRINDEVRAWMLGKRPEPPAAAAGENGAAWTRVYSGAGPVDCARLGRALAAMGAERMVIGHTPQQHGMSSACDGKVWRIDVGLSHHYGGPMQVLEIDRKGPRVLK